MAGVAAAEAGYANDSHDKGGETIRGIARNSHPTWPGWAKVDQAKATLGLHDTLDAGRAVWAKIDQHLSSDAAFGAQVRQLFRSEYWTPLGLETEPSQRIADKAYDIAVNQGVEVARGFLEDARKAAADA